MYFFLDTLLQNANPNVVSNIVGIEQSIFGNLLNFWRIVGTGLALVMITWMSISYFTADGRSFPGSIERKADIKGKQLSKFVIGLAVFIGASNILYFLAVFVMDIIEKSM